MQVLVNTDNHIEGREELTRRVEDEVEAILGRFGAMLTRVEVHLSDTNSHKSGQADKRCQVETRLSGLQPFSVTKSGATIEEALSAAVETMEQTLESHLTKLDQKKGQTPMGGQGFI